MVEGTEPAVQRDQALAVFHLEILVVQGVDLGVTVQSRLCRQFDLVEAHMSGNRAKPGDMPLIQRNARVRRDASTGSTKGWGSPIYGESNAPICTARVWGSADGCRKSITRRSRAQSTQTRPDKSEDRQSRAKPHSRWQNPTA